mgnify:CR=1 FL=1
MSTVERLTVANVMGTESITGQMVTSGMANTPTATGRGMECFLNQTIKSSMANGSGMSR